jgi:hypothetical protein
MSERQLQIVKEMGELLDKQKELFEMLPRSIRIAQIWPEAFKDGMTCSPILIGVNYPDGHLLYRSIDEIYPKPYERVREITRTYLKRKDGEEYDISTEDFFSIITAGP